MAAIARRIGATAPDEGLVITCSALKLVYREVLRAANPDTFFVHLAIDPGDAITRVASRGAHFMPTSLVASQFETLEPLESDEAGMTLNATLPPLQIVSEVQARSSPQDRCLTHGDPAGAMAERVPTPGGEPITRPVRPRRCRSEAHRAREG